MPLDPIDPKDLIQALRKMVDSGKSGETPQSFPMASLAILAAYARPFVMGVMAAITGQDDIDDTTAVPMTPQQSNDFIMAILVFGVAIGRYYEQLEKENWPKPQFNAPTMDQ